MFSGLAQGKKIDFFFFRRRERQNSSVGMGLEGSSRLVGGGSGTVVLEQGQAAWWLWWHQVFRGFRIWGGFEWLVLTEQ